jgi:hypothetical protein
MFAVLIAAADQQSGLRQQELLFHNQNIPPLAIIAKL